MDYLVDDDALIDVLTIFIGVFSVISAAILVTINVLLEPSLGIPDPKDGLAVALASLDSAVFLTTIVAILVAITLLNDLFITRTGRILTIYASLALSLCGALLYLVKVPSLVCLVPMAASVGLFVLIWGAILSTLNSRVLVVILMFSSILAGIITLVGTRFETAGTFALFALLSLISWLSMRRISPVFLGQIALVDRRQSIERHVRGKGNSFTLILVGGMLGIITVLIRNIGLTSGEMTLALGACLLVAGLIVTFFYRDLLFSLGDVMKRLLGLIMIVGLLPFPFLDRVGRIVCTCFLLVAGIVNLILIIDSILETSRFNQISPFWIIGLEGGVFFTGFLAVLVLATALVALTSQGLMITVFALVGAGSILQIHINNQAYPLFRMPVANVDEPLGAETALDDEIGPEAFVQGSAFWRNRINRIAAEHRLSSRQSEIMELLVKGRDLNYITMHFNISRSTAKTHVSNLYRKMNIHSKQELIDLVEPLQGEGASRR